MPRPPPRIQLALPFADGAEPISDWICAVLDELPNIATREQLALARRLDQADHCYEGEWFRPTGPSLEELRERAGRLL